MRNATRALFVVLVTLVVGAGPAGAGTPPRWACAVTVSIAPGPGYDVAVDALEQLDAASPIHWIQVGYAGRVDVQWRHPDDPTAGGMATVWWNSKRITRALVEIDPATPVEWLPRRVLHEFGHVGGIGHNSDPESVMSPAVEPLTEYGPSDLAGLAAVRCR